MIHHILPHAQVCADGCISHLHNAIEAASPLEVMELQRLHKLAVELADKIDKLTRAIIAEKGAE